MKHRTYSEECTRETKQKIKRKYRSNAGQQEYKNEMDDNDQSSNHQSNNNKVSATEIKIRNQ